MVKGGLDEARGVGDGCGMKTFRGDISWGSCLLERERGVLKVC